MNVRTGDIKLYIYMYINFKTLYVRDSERERECKVRSMDYTKKRKQSCYQHTDQDTEGT